MTTDGPAETILKQLGITEPGEIDLEAIAWHLGVRIRCRPLESCEARILGGGSGAIMAVNSRSSLRRRRFSIGHELGHWHHHRGKILVCRADEIGQVGPEKLHPERMADRFASRLLMPEYLFRPAAQSHRKIDFKAVQALADLFATSRTATAIRLVEGQLFTGCLICHRPYGRKWFARSPAIPERWFPRPDLSPESFAFTTLFSRSPEIPAPRKISASAWFDRREADRYDVYEQTVRTADDEIITLVQISEPQMLR